MYSVWTAAVLFAGSALDADAAVCGAGVDDGGGHRMPQDAEVSSFEPTPLRLDNEVPRRYARWRDNRDRGPYRAAVAGGVFTALGVLTLLGGQVVLVEGGTYEAIAPLAIGATATSAGALWVGLAALRHHRYVSEPLPSRTIRDESDRRWMRSQKLGKGLLVSGAIVVGAGLATALAAFPIARTGDDEADALATAGSAGPTGFPTTPYDDVRPLEQRLQRIHHSVRVTTWTGFGLAAAGFPLLLAGAALEAKPPPVRATVRLRPTLGPMTGLTLTGRW